MPDESFIKVNINLEKPTQLEDRTTTQHSPQTEKRKQKNIVSRPILDCQTVAYRLKMRGMVIIGMLVHIPSIGKAVPRPGAGPSPLPLLFTYTHHYTN